MQLLFIGLLEDSIGTRFIQKSAVDSQSRMFAQEMKTECRALVVLKVPMMYLQKLKVLILVAWPNCCLNDCIVDFPSPLVQLHLALKFIPSLNNCVTLLSFVKYCIALLVVLRVFRAQILQLQPVDVA